MENGGGSRTSSTVRKHRARFTRKVDPMQNRYASSGSPAARSLSADEKPRSGSPRASGVAEHTAGFRDLQVPEIHPTPTYCIARLERDRRLASLQARVKHSVIALLSHFAHLAKRETGELIMRKSEPFSLFRLSRSTISRRLQWMDANGFLIYLPGHGRGNVSRIILLHETWGNAPVAQLTLALKEKGSLSPQFLVDAIRNTRAPTRKEEVRYPQTPTTKPQAAPTRGLALRILEKWEAKYGPCAHLPRTGPRTGQGSSSSGLPRETIEKAWKQVLREYNDITGKIPETIGLLVAFCRNGDSWEQRTKRINETRQRYREANSGVESPRSRKQRKAMQAMKEDLYRQDHDYEAYMAEQNRRIPVKNYLMSVDDWPKIRDYITMAKTMTLREMDEIKAVQAVSLENSELILGIPTQHQPPSERAEAFIRVGLRKAAPGITLKAIVQIERPAA